MLIGNVGNDPEVRYLNDAQKTKTARIRLATTERFTDRNGETRENTEWHTITTYRRSADIIEKYVRKGSQIYVEGKLQTREWNDQNGNRRNVTEIIADNIQLLGRRSDNPSAAPSQGREASQDYMPRTYQAAPSPAPQSYDPGQAYADSPAGPGGYQAPYNPSIPGTPAASPVSEDSSSESSDDLPF